MLQLKDKTERPKHRIKIAEYPQNTATASVLTETIPVKRDG